MTPCISAVVPTRNRPDHAAPCAESTLANPGDDFELLIIHQSDDDATERALAAHDGDSRIRYIRSSSRGLSAARNVGMERSTAPIIAFTDDDCRVLTQRSIQLVAWDAADTLKSRCTSNDNTMTPRISLVPTRNRHDHAAPCACSILADAGDDFELSVIDQSDAAATKRLWQFTPAIIAFDTSAPLPEEPPPPATVGSSKARRRSSAPPTMAAGYRRTGSSRFLRSSSENRRLQRACYHEFPPRTWPGGWGRT